ncbi:VOC family protein [Phytoactinopolyspora endophytica]|uniref:VOC family protein n=1 Tax=Phytoactinopolyspora endophytica TaxID=1642495 RepID=UPI00101CDB50|nr:VOC family protein [Phytoactinopolyspora endophytica]
MSRMTFINLPVQDLARTVEFFTKLGFSFDETFTDENATCMIISDDSYVMLLVEPFFKGFTNAEIPDPTKSSEVIVGLSAQSREEIDALRGTAVEAGAESLGDPQDDGFMYMWGFRDLDGHQWSFIYMDDSAVPEQ